MELGIHLYFQIFSLVLSIFIFIKKRNKVSLYFIPFLFLTVLIELIGTWYVYKGYRNYWMYNVFTTIEFLFYTTLFYIHFKKILFQRIVLVFIPLFVLCVVLNILFIQGFNKTFNTYTFLLGSFFIVIFCCLFFYESV